MQEIAEVHTGKVNLKGNEFIIYVDRAGFYRIKSDVGRCPMEDERFTGKRQAQIAIDKYQNDNSWRLRNYAEAEKRGKRGKSQGE